MVVRVEAVEMGRLLMEVLAILHLLVHLRATMAAMEQQLKHQYMRLAVVVAQ
jgi:hypothetical protein